MFIISSFICKKDQQACFYQYINVVEFEVLTTMHANLHPTTYNLYFTSKSFIGIALLNTSSMLHTIDEN